MLNKKEIYFYLCNLVVADQRDDLSKAESEKFSVIIGEVERLHEMGIFFFLKNCLVAEKIEKVRKMSFHDKFFFLSNLLINAVERII